MYKKNKDETNGCGCRVDLVIYSLLSPDLALTWLESGGKLDKYQTKHRKQQKYIGGSNKNKEGEEYTGNRQGVHTHLFQDPHCCSLANTLAVNPTPNQTKHIPNQIEKNITKPTQNKQN